MSAPTIAPSPTRSTVQRVLTELVRIGTTRPEGTELDLRADGSELVLGRRPDLPDGGCLDCARAWREDASGLTPDPFDRSWLTRHPWRTTVDTVIRAQLSAPPPAGVVLVLRRDDAGLSRHSFLRHPGCADPAHDVSLPARGATPLDLDRPQPALGGTLRVRELSTQAWAERLGDRRQGPVPLTYRDETSPLSLVTAEFVTPGRHGREHGYGRSGSYTDSLGPALLEGIERVLGARRPAEVDAITATADELGEDALDLRLLGEHEPGVLGTGTPDHPASGTAPTTWVAGWSAVRQRPLWVPEQIAYWRVPDGQRRFVYESSNGCAVGGSLEEAALHGYYEVVERDAFLLAWYSRTRLRRVRGADEDPQIGHLADTLAGHGLTLEMLDLTSDHGVPSALALVTAPDQLAADDRFPSLSLAAATHADGRKALRTAVQECATNVLMYQRWSTLRPSVSHQRRRPMLEDFDRVEVLEDHTGLHGLPQARPLNEFLRHPAGEVDVDAFCQGPVHPDVTTQLRGHLERLGELGSDLVVVDQTDSVLAGVVPVHAVKVVVPGAVPMTFGHRHRRLRNLPRLHRAGSLIEGGVPWTSPAQIVPTPHPFP